MIMNGQTFAIRSGQAAAIAAVVLALAIGFAVQTARLEGLKIWPVAIEGWKPKAERLDQALANVKVAEQLAAAWAEAARLNQEARYRAVAQRTDIDAREATSVALGDAEQFIARGGHAGQLRAQADRGAGSPAGTGSGNRGPGDPEGAGAPAELDEAEGQLIGVTADDVRICTVNTVKAEAAREWALGLEEASAPAAQGD